MKLILPMAGNGQRFFDAGYDLPKPLIDIKGKPMFARVIENLWCHNVQPWCIVRQDHVNEYEIDIPSCSSNELLVKIKLIYYLNFW